MEETVGRVAGDAVKTGNREEEQIMWGLTGPFKDFCFYIEWTEKILEFEQRGNMNGCANDFDWGVECN